MAENKIGGGTPSTKINAYWNGDLPWIQSSDIEEGIVLKANVKKKITKLGLDKSSAKLVPEKSIAIVTRVGVGKLAYMPYQYSTSQDFLSLSNLKEDHFFLTYLLYKTLNEGANSQGTSIKGITKDYLLSINMFVPSKDEQRKIGKLFSKIDTTITLQQRKLNSLQKLKKGLLQKMFPKNGENIPEIRFPEFSDAWKQCKLSDLVNVIDGDRGKNYPTEADFEPHGHTLFLNASNVTIDGFLFDTNQFITEEKSNSMGSGKIIKDDIIITSRGSLGHIAWYNDSVQQVMPHLRINSGMLILRNKANVKTSYLHQFMKSDKGKAQIVFMSFGSAQPQLTKKGVESFTVNYPIDTEEQIKIGAFFSKIDNTITLQQRWLFYTHKQS